MSTLTSRIPGMPPVFGGQVGFIKAPLTEVAERVVAWHEGLGLGPMRVDVDGGLVESATMLLPLGSAPVIRSLLVGTRGGEWTACFDANPSGGDPGGVLSVVGDRHGAATLMVTAVPFQGDSGAIGRRPGGYLLSYSWPGREGPPRSIAVIEGEYSSSRYHYEAWGPVQSWEEPEHYTARRKRDRLTPALIEKYCRALGIDVFDLDFYCGPSVFIERTRFSSDGKTRRLQL
ncbi:hypothetical protein [Microbacterium sp. No. 7]|uniref:hypothetical protein n=1 Tax=Microbacterium sp. No. 7 TaxID=1714373 RepID=UPI0006ED2351|nr:hypothetical protein [Microbacterium sp. No. 7]ALJ21134.1 hypothetical protein AOA12_14980 [Microbacterium sp. No. 7]